MKNKDRFDLRQVECVLISEDSLHRQTWMIRWRGRHEAVPLHLFSCLAGDFWLTVYNDWLEQEEESGN